MMKKSSNIDMLHGPIAMKMMLLAIPIFLTATLEQLFNAADMVVIGRFAGGNSLAAVGDNMFIINLMVNIFVGLSIGSNVVIARLLGKGDQQGVVNAVHTSILVSIVSGFALAIIGWFVAEPVLTLMDTPPDILHEAVVYFRIYFLGMPFFMLYNFGAAILRSKGDTRRPLYVLAASGVVNIILNLFFVVNCHMSVAGVAWATTISSALSSLMLLLMLMHERGALKVRLSELRIEGESLKEIVSVGLPAGLQGAIFSFSNVVIQGGINSLGANAVAATAAAIYTDYIAYFVMLAISQAAMSFLSQNYGAGNITRCRRIIWISIILSTICTAVISWLMILLRYGVVSIFCTDPAVIELAVTRIEIVLCLYILNSAVDLLSSLMRAVGYSLVPAIICIVGICGTRITWATFIFPSHHTFDWMMYCYPLSWIITLAVMIPVAIRTLKRTLTRIEVNKNYRIQ